MAKSANAARTLTVRGLLRGGIAAAAVAFAATAYVYVTLPDVRVLAETNPETTAFMELRTREAAAEDRELDHVRSWVPYSRISASLKRAVLVAEDSAFWDHDGIDIEQIRESVRIAWEEGGELRGASTITQQLAKNLYLSPSRDPLRKLRELIIARRLEAELPKARIFEIYLNSIEWGDGVWGAEAAARRYFGVPASQLNAQQSALLAGAIINPRVLDPARPNARLRRRQQIILSRMGEVTPPPTVPVVVAEQPVEAHEAVPVAPHAPTIPAETEPASAELPDEFPAEVPPGTDVPVEPAPVPFPQAPNIPSNTPETTTSS